MREAIQSLNSGSPNCNQPDGPASGGALKKITARHIANVSSPICGSPRMYASAASDGDAPSSQSKAASSPSFVDPSSLGLYW